MKCMIRLLSSCGSKHKNYIAQHENELEKSMREMVDDLGDVIISCHDQKPKDLLIEKAQCCCATLNSEIKLS